MPKKTAIEGTQDIEKTTKRHTKNNQGPRKEENRRYGTCAFIWEELQRWIKRNKQAGDKERPPWAKRKRNMGDPYMPKPEDEASAHGVEAPGADREKSTISDKEAQGKRR